MYQASESLDVAKRELELSILTDESEYRKRRTASEKKAAEFTTEDWKKLRKLAKTDTFFLAHTVLNYTKLSTNLHGDVCNWIRETQEDRYRLLLLPRGHYKSTIYTIANSIQAALPNDDNSNIWPYCLGTNIRICLMHEVAGVASKFLSEVQNHFLSNEFLMALFPECIPDPRKHTINMNQLELPRTSFWKEKTFESMGVGGRSQGNHYNWLKPDDLMGKEAKDSKIILQSTNDWIDNLQSFLTSHANPDHIDFTGTRWAHDDTYQHIMDAYGDQLKIFVRSIEVKEIVSDEKSPDFGRSKVVGTIFPEEYPLERLEILKKNREIYSAQYCNDPESAGSELDIAKLRYYYWRKAANKLVPESFIAFDNRTGQNGIFYQQELDKIILLDPAMSGEVGMIVTGTDRNHRNFVLEAVKKSFKTPELIRDLFNLVIKWRVRAVVFESVLFSALYEPILTNEMHRRGIRFRIIPQTVPRKIDKESRIKNSLSSYLDAGSLFINETQENLITEFKRFGYTQSIHLLDALSLGPQHWRAFNGSIDTTSQNYPQSVERDATTGYTVI